MRTRRELQETPVYVASAWWRNCEPFVTIVGGSQKAVETTIQAVMLQTATDAYNEQGSKKRERDDFLDPAEPLFQRRGIHPCTLHLRNGEPP